METKRVLHLTTHWKLIYCEWSWLDLYNQEIYSLTSLVIDPIPWRSSLLCCRLQTNELAHFHYLKIQPALSFAQLYSCLPPGWSAHVCFQFSCWICCAAYRSSESITNCSSLFWLYSSIMIFSFILGISSTFNSKTWNRRFWYRWWWSWENWSSFILSPWHRLCMRPPI